MTPETHDSMMAAQDRVLIAASDGDLDYRSLTSLPPWRAVLFARVLHKSGLLTDRQLVTLVIEAAHVGGLGRLKVKDAP